MKSMLRYHRRRLGRSLAGKLALLSPRFHPLFPMDAALDMQEYRWQGEPDKLVVFLPGIDDLPEDFERRGFVEGARLDLGADAVSVDAHLGHYLSRRLHGLLHREVIQRARADGYEQIWMVGISLGGFGAMTYAAARPKDVGGIVLLAPYLGGSGLIREIARAGGVRRWVPGAVDEGDHQRRLWSWIKRECGGGRPDMPIYLGYGKGDRFADAHLLLAEVLPASHVVALPGGHDWKTWVALWRQFLRRRQSLFRSNDA